MESLFTDWRIPMPYSALSSNRELDQAGPRPSARCAVGGGRQVAAIDGRTAGGVGDQHPVTEQLGDQFDVWGFTTAGTGAGELKQRPNQLAALDGGRVDWLVSTSGQAP